MMTFLDTTGAISRREWLLWATVPTAVPEKLQQDLRTCLGLTEFQEDKARDYALALLGVLNRLGKVEDRYLPDASAIGEVKQYRFLPHDNTDWKWGWTIRRQELQLLDKFPDGQITLARTDAGMWRFSPKTIESIEDFSTAVRDLPVIYGIDVNTLSFSLWIETHLPESLVTRSFLGMAYWKWIGLFAVIFLGMILDQIIRAILRVLWRRITRKHKTDVDKRTLKRAVIPFGLFASAIVWYVGLRVLGLPMTALNILLFSVRLVLMLSAVWAGFRVVDLVTEYLARRAAHTHTKIDDLLVPLLRKTLKIFILALGVVYIAGALHLNIIPLLTGLSIGGLAVAIAAKDTIENFFGSIAVIVDRPFEVGDWVVIGDTEGTVEHLGFRSTRVRTFYNSLITMPNAMLVRTNVDNFGRRRYRRVKTHIGITYDTPPEKIEAFCEGIRHLVRTHPYTRKDYYQVWLHEFGPSSLDILIYIFHEAPDWSTELRERERLFLDIIRLAHKLGVEFAFPTQTLHLHREEPPASPSMDERLHYVEPDAQRLGRRAVNEIISGADWREKRPGPVNYSATIPPDDDEESQVESRVGGDG